MIRTTADTLFDGSVSIRQPARNSGYRVNVDAILLAAFAARRMHDRQGGGNGVTGRRAPSLPLLPRRYRHAVDLGSGVGAVGLSLLHLGAAEHVTMVEIDQTLAELARENAEANGWSDRVDVVHADVTRAARDLRARADLVVCNPPYVSPGHGREPRQAVRAAKYGGLDAFVEAARSVAGRRARVCFVYPAVELTNLFAALRARGLEPKRLRAVHGRAGDDARVVLVECAPGKPGGLSIEPPFVENEGRERSRALANLLATRRR